MYLSIFPEDGMLIASINRFMIGQQSIPLFLTEIPLMPIIEKSFNEFNLELGKYIRIDAVELNEGELVLIGELIVE
jgi:hypothetical protein